MPDTHFHSLRDGGMTERYDPKESDLKKSAYQLLRLYGPRAYWLPIAGGTGQRRGSPDCVVVFDGRTVFVEFKRPGRPIRLSTDQERERRRILAAGGSYAVVASLEDLRAALDLPGLGL